MLRDNEGEAAEHGIYYDDTHYDYMQHMRELGGIGGDTTWMEAPQTKTQQKAKAKPRLEDALREISLDDDDAQSLGGASFGGLSFAGGMARKPSNPYQNQQDVPDALSGFQPDMDPRLREILEALDDEAYVDDDDDIFEELAASGGKEVDLDEWQATSFDDAEDDGWESDDTTKPAVEYRTGKDASDTSQIVRQDTKLPEISAMQSEMEVPDAMPAADDGDWLESFAKTKSSAATQPARKIRQPADVDVASSMLSSSTQFGRKKKRKGALTSSTGFSMTSSALARTESLSLLDARFDKLAESYMGDLDEEDDEFDDTASMATATTNRTNASRFSAFGGSQASEAPQLMPAGFDSVMDDFLYSNAGVKGRQMKKGGTGGRWGAQTGMQQLDEIRGGLIPPKVRGASRS